MRTAQVYTDPLTALEILRTLKGKEPRVLESLRLEEEAPAVVRLTVPEIRRRRRD